MDCSTLLPPKRRYRPELEREIEPLLQHLKQEQGFDFTGYRRASLARRIQRRMDCVGLDDIGEYHALLHECSDEAARLIDAILINVTSFFRDEPSWDCLAERVIPELVERKAGKIRVWSAGCASGEEAYTLAMLFAEVMGAKAYKERVTIHATDIDEDALRRARRARYGEHEVSELPVALRRKYFRSVSGHHSIRAELRGRIRFRRHDIVAHAPIAGVDLLACRNTLMYLNTDTQRRVLRRFHRALNDRGVLFLGRAETLLTHDTGFEPIDLKRRISMKAPVA